MLRLLVTGPGYYGRAQLSTQLTNDSHRHLKSGHTPWRSPRADNSREQIDARDAIRGEAAFVLLRRHRLDEVSRCPSLSITAVLASESQAADARKCNQTPVQTNHCEDIARTSLTRRSRLAASPGKRMQHAVYQHLLCCITASQYVACQRVWDKNLALLRLQSASVENVTGQIF